MRVNQVGYLTEGPKRATLVTTETSPVAWELLSGGLTVVAYGTTTPRGVDPTAGVLITPVPASPLTLTVTNTFEQGHLQILKRISGAGSQNFASSSGFLAKRFIVSATLYSPTWLA